MAFDTSDFEVIQGPTKIPKEVQAGRDSEALKILRAERMKPTNSPEDNAALDREIARMSGQPVPKKAPAFDMSDFEVEEAAPAPAPMPQQAAPAPAREPTWRERAMTAIRGLGQGATAGLIQYPQAGLTSLVNDMPFKESLAGIRADNARMAKEDPLAWYGGTTAGGALATIGTGGGAGALQLGARTGLLGGVSGFTEKESLKDAAIGATVGGVLGAAGGAAASKIDNVVKANLKPWLETRRGELADSAISAVKQIPGIEKLGPNPTNTQLRRFVWQQAGKGVEAAKSAKSHIMNWGQRNVQLDKLENVAGEELYRLAGGKLKTATARELPAFMKETQEAGLRAAKGAVEGAARGLPMGNPVVGAKLGALRGVGSDYTRRAGNLAQRAVVAQAVKSPRLLAAVPETTARIGTLAGTQALIEGMEPYYTEEELAQIYGR